MTKKQELMQDERNMRREKERAIEEAITLLTSENYTVISGDEDDAYYWLVEQGFVFPTDADRPLIVTFTGSIQDAEMEELMTTEFQQYGYNRLKHLLATS